MTGFKSALEDALEKMPNYAGEVCRGTDLPKRVFERIEVEEVFEDKNYVSSSLQKGREFNGKHTLRWRPPPPSSPERRRGRCMTRWWGRMRNPNACDEAPLEASLNAR